MEATGCICVCKAYSKDVRKAFAKLAKEVLKVDLSHTRTIFSIISVSILESKQLSCNALESLSSCTVIL